MGNFTRWFEKFVDQCDGISVYFIDDANTIFNSDIDSKVLGKYRESFCKELRSKYTNNDSFSVPMLSNFDERQHALYKYDFSPKEMPFDFNLTEEVLAYDATRVVPTYQAKHDKLSNIRASIVLLSCSALNESIAFFQYIFPVSLLGSDKGVLNITTHKTRLVELEHDVLKLNANFVFMQAKKHYFVENVNTLETRLHFKEVIHSRAHSYSSKLEELGIVEDLTKFNERIDKETSFARKLVKAYKNSAVIKDKISNEKIIEFAESQEYYSKHLKANEAGSSFKLDSIVKCKRFLELLNDNFLKSELTEQNYLARSKDLV
ncbi:DUF4868 domain-containing protein [Vibrio sp. ZSDZ65]|uniref:DUF4868 domain-containing protein n=1 Tax=Vibrio qingdaonensis TaxID=2829491 RepID=A0A9X3CMS4_9VIBR|nr:anti-phage protein KwaB [Vibrio qingdaonensis]MCW8345984.1 DUF4868 domain-containing protein [Vibrio qingdaonensis]